MPHFMNDPPQSLAVRTDPEAHAVILVAKDDLPPSLLSLPPQRARGARLPR